MPEGVGYGGKLLGAEILPLEVLAAESEIDAEPSDEESVDRDIQSTVTALIEEALNHYVDHIEPDQAEATDRYYARPYGNEKKGRSRVLATDFRDAVLDRVPDLIEIFMGSDRPVEFQPYGEEDVPLARQMTDYVNHQVFERNPGFLAFNSVFKDADTRRLGYLKWWWEDESRVEGSTHTGLTESDLMVFEQDEEVEYEIIREYEGEEFEPDSQTGQMTPQPALLYDVEVTHTESRGRLRIEAIPPEEVFWTPEARSFGDSQIIVHSRVLPRDQVLLFGLPEDLVDENIGQKASKISEHLAYARQFYGDSKLAKNRTSESETADESQDMVLFSEAYVLIDADDDGVGELRMFQCVGPNYTINPEMPMGELVSHVPIAVFTPDPEPHTIPGLCLYDHTKDIQRIKTDIQRAQLNSLAQAVEPQLAFQDKAVNITDLLNPEITGFIRVRGDVNNSIREIKTQFVGSETLSVLAYYDQLKADRTGAAGPREGLDPNVLQSTTREAVANTLQANQRRIKYTARVYGEVGMRAAFKGILRTLVENKAPAEVVRLRGDWVEVDPRSWDADRDVVINVALGVGSKEERVSALLQIAERQEAHMQQGSPIVGFEQIRNTYSLLTDLLGYKDTNTFWKPWGPEEQAQLEQQQQAQQPPPDPAMLLAQVEQMRAQVDAQIEQAKFQLEQQKAVWENDLNRDKLAQEGVLKEREIEAKYAVQLQDNEVKAQIDAARAALDADIKREAAQAAAQQPTQE